MTKKLLKYIFTLKEKVCYYLDNKRDRDMGERKMEKTKNGILYPRDFACYIKTRYFEKYQKNISPIKLQKSLYFCFAYWAGFVFKSKNSEEVIDLSPYLFKETFKAWSYGPVIPSIFHEEKEGTLVEKVSEDELFKENELVKETVNSLLDDIFEISDFKLVNLSHADKCWQNNFDADAKKHDKEIKLDEIIREYSYKY